MAEETNPTAKVRCAISEDSFCATALRFQSGLTSALGVSNGLQKLRSFCRARLSSIRSTRQFVQECCRYIKLLRRRRTSSASRLSVQERPRKRPNSRDVLVLVALPEAWRLSSFVRELQLRDRVAVRIVMSDFDHACDPATQTARADAFALIAHELGVEFAYIPYSAKERDISLRKLTSAAAVVTNQPYKWLNPHLKPWRFSGILAYSPYAYNITNLSYHTNEKTILSSDIVFCESRWHKRLYLQSNPSLRNSLIVSGVSTVWNLLRESSSSLEACKSVLWAPHWTSTRTPESLDDFGVVGAVLGECVQEGLIDLTVRPHPLLHQYLISGDSSSARRAWEAYQALVEIRGIRVDVNSDITELLTQATVLIHNSGSFLAEYGALSRPSVFVAGRDSFILENLSPVGAFLAGGADVLRDLPGLRAAIYRGLQGQPGLQDARESVRAWLAGDHLIDPSTIMAKELITRL